MLRRDRARRILREELVAIGNRSDASTGGSGRILPTVLIRRSGRSASSPQPQLEHCAGRIVVAFHGFVHVQGRGEADPRWRVDFDRSRWRTSKSATLEVNVRPPWRFPCPPWACKTGGRPPSPPFLSQAVVGWRFSSPAGAGGRPRRADSSSARVRRTWRRYRIPAGVVGCSWAAAGRTEQGNRGAGRQNDGHNLLAFRTIFLERVGFTDPHLYVITKRRESRS